MSYVGAAMRVIASRVLKCIIYNNCSSYYHKQAVWINFQHVIGILIMLHVYLSVYIGENGRVRGRGWEGRGGEEG